MISDEDLLLYYYRDGLEPDERARIGAALTAQPELARRLHALVARLDAAAALPEVDVPDATRQRWQQALTQAERAPVKLVRAEVPARRRAWSRPQWQIAAGVGAVALALALFRGLPEKPPVVAEQPNVTAPGTKDDASAYEHGLKWHLASTERQIASLDQATPEERAKLVEAIIGQNRIYALAAERAGEPQLARVLRAFTPLLESAARGEAAGGNPATEEDLAQLAFELRVMQARLGAAAKPPTNTL
jgi:hypothetical protein